MLKKWVHIFLSLWLINSVTYFHASNPADLESPELCNSFFDTCLKLNTWADCIVQSLIKDDDDASGKVHKIKFQRRYVRSHSANDNAYISVNHLLIDHQHIKKAVANRVNHYSIGVALLPAYYSFLFRLCPF